MLDLVRSKSLKKTSKHDQSEQSINYLISLPYSVDCQSLSFFASDISCALRNSQLQTLSEVVKKERLSRIGMSLGYCIFNRILLRFLAFWVQRQLGISVHYKLLLNILRKHRAKVTLLLPEKLFVLNFIVSQSSNNRTIVNGMVI